jgi:hypothetical protein
MGIDPTHPKETRKKIQLQLKGHGQPDYVDITNEFQTITYKKRASELDPKIRVCPPHLRYITQPHDDDGKLIDALLHAHFKGKNAIDT